MSQYSQLFPRGVTYTAANKAGDTFTGPVAGPTPPQFDNSGLLATSAFVQRALGSFANELPLGGSTALSTAHIGYHLQLNVASATFTLPAVSTVPLGAAIWFHSGGDGNIVKAAGTDNLWAGPGTNLAQITLNAGDDLVAIKSTSTAWTVEGTGALKYANLSVLNFYASGVISSGGNINAGATLTGANITTPGNLTVSGNINGNNIAAGYNMSAVNNFNCPSINLSTRMWLTANANYSYIFMDTAGGNQCYVEWNYNTTTLSFVLNGAGRLTINNSGQATFYNGLQVNGTFGCGAQGFFSGNLNAPINAGIAANCVMVGYFSSGAWFNMQCAGVNVSANACTAGYGSGGSVNWSCAASDRNLKENIEPPTLDPVDVVRKLPIWQCDYVAPRPNDEDLEDPAAWPQVREHWPFSFMADEVDAAMSCATIKRDGAPVALHPQHLIATLWAAVQQLTDRLESAEAKLGGNP